MSLDHTYQSHVFSADVVEDGPRKALKFRSEPYLRHFLNKMRVGEMLTVTITNKRPKRTLAQHNFLWVYYSHIAQETGHTPEEIHEWAKGMFLTTGIKKVLGKDVRIKGSTTNLSVSEFSEYVMRIAAETQIEPPPTENYGLVSLRPELV